MFSRETYIERRARLVADMKYHGEKGLLLFLGNDESGMNYKDNTYPFRQDSTFLYFFGLDFPGLGALLDIDEGISTVFGDELTIDDIVWMGSQPTLRERCDNAGVDRTEPAARLKDQVQRAMNRGRMVHFLPAYRPEHTLRIFDLTGLPGPAQTEQASIPFVKSVVNMRNHKSPAEIDQIEEAVDISVEMHQTMMRMVRPGISEAEVASAVTEIALRKGAGLSFPVIATVNGQTLHNHYHGNILQEGDLFLLDAGAESSLHYAGDLSSTAPVSKRFTEQQKMIYDMALHAHTVAVDALRPGIAFREIHLKVAETIAADLKSIGLVTGDPAEVAGEGAYAMFFPCGLGHMLGLDVHDMENLGEVWVGYDGHPKSATFGFKSLRLARPLEPGFVLTIEPGIYFIPELIDLWRNQGKFKNFLNYDEIEKFKGFGGLRNEEDYLITPDGKRRLGHLYKPMTADEVEAMKQ